MPSKKRCGARFPPARIKKIMQTDEEIGKVAAPVPILISRALELFLEQILAKSSEVVTARGVRTLSKSHIKHAVQSVSTFDFLKDLVADIEDIPDIEEVKEDIPKNNNTTSSNSGKNCTTKKRGRPRKCVRQDSESDTMASNEFSRKDDCRRDSASRSGKNSPDESVDDTNEDVDESMNEDEEKPAHGMKDIMLPLVVAVEDDIDAGKELDKCAGDSVAAIPVPVATPIATPLASPSISRHALTESIQSLGCNSTEDDDYDS